MCNICRPFVLYNDFLPPTHEKHERWQFLSFGYYDGVFVGNNLCKERSGSLEGLWDYFLKYSNELDGSYSSQIIFGLRHEEDNVKKDLESELWDKGEKRKEFPFLFLSLIQVNSGDKNLKNGWNDCGELEARLTSEDVKAFTYLTFDSSDLILALFCRRYADGANIIDKFHRDPNSELQEIVGWRLTYSFTVASIDKNVLNNDEEIAKINDVIDVVNIHLMEKSPSSINRVYDILCEELDIDEKEQGKKCRKNSILGCNDEMFILKEIPWNKFLGLYQDNKGLLNHSSENYEKYLLGVTTIIGKANLLACVSENNDNSNFTDPVLSKSMRMKCQGSDFLPGISKDNVESIQRSLLQVINSLQKFETSPFHDYLFRSSLLPLNMVIDMALEAKGKEKINDFIDSFYEFMKGFDLYVQDSSRPDRQFTQVPDFNIKIYDTPVKLTAFYNAYIYYVKEYLNGLDYKSDIKHDYEFLACPGITNNMRVREYFKKISDIKRLFLVEIPEKQVYQTKMMMIMLAHEIGHFVGKNIRKRAERFKCIREIIAKIVVSCMYKNLGGINSDIDKIIQDDDYWHMLESELHQLLSEDTDQKHYFDEFLNMLSGTVSQESTEQLYTYWNARKYHSEMVKNFLKSRITYHLLNENNRLWDYLIEKTYCYWIEKCPRQAEQKRIEMREIIKNKVNVMMSDSLWSPSMFSVSKAIDALIEIMKECVADLICILTLELDAESYYETIICSAKDQGFEVNFTGNEAIVIRSALVTHCMRSDLGIDGLGYEWSQDNFCKIIDRVNVKENQDFLTNLERYIISFLNRYLEENVTVNPTTQITNVNDIFQNQDILEVIIRYLLECKKEFKECNDKIKDKQDELKSIYQMFETEDIGELVIKMQSFITKYLDELSSNSACI